MLGVRSESQGACCLPLAGSWNGRGIFFGSSAGDRTRHKKLAHLTSLVSKVDLLGVQETHAQHASALNFAQGFQSSHWFSWSSCDSTLIYENGPDSMVINNDLVSCDSTDGELGGNSCSADSSSSVSSSFGSMSESGSDTSDCSTPSRACASSLKESSSRNQARSLLKSGGVMSFIRKRAFSSAANCYHVSLVPGRCIETIVNDVDVATHFINVHFHGWSLHDANKVADRLRVLLQEAAASPLSVRVILLGDLNIRFAEKPVLDLASQKATFKEPKHSKVAKVLLGCLGGFTRIEHDHFSHFNSSLNHLNDIDHIYLSAPGWIQLRWRFEVEVQKPEDLFARGISDHGAILCSFRPSQLPPKEQPIPTWAAKLPNSKICLEKLVQASRLQDLLPEHAIDEYKLLIKEAARHARNQHCDLNRESPKMHLQNLILVSRLIIGNQTKQAKQLIMSSAFFFARIIVVGERVLPVDAHDLTLEFREHKTAHFQHLITFQLDKPKPNHSKISAATRLAKLWRTLSPVQSIPAIMSREGVKCTKVHDKATELGRVWAGTFSISEGIPEAALTFLSKLGIKWPLSDTPAPLIADFVSFIKNLKDSATGPDGIPYSCYKALIDLSSTLFFFANLALLAGGLLGPSFNIQRGCFIPKSKPLDGKDPRADELRTLGLKTQIIKS